MSTADSFAFPPMTSVSSAPCWMPKNQFGSGSNIQLSSPASTSSRSTKLEITIVIAEDVETFNSDNIPSTTTIERELKLRLALPSMTGASKQLKSFNVIVHHDVSRSPTTSTTANTSSVAPHPFKHSDISGQKSLLGSSNIPASVPSSTTTPTPRFSPDFSQQQWYHEPQQYEEQPRRLFRNYLPPETVSSSQDHYDGNTNRATSTQCSVLPHPDTVSSLSPCSSKSTMEETTLSTNPNNSTLNGNNKRRRTVGRIKAVQAKNECDATDQ